MFFSMVKGRLYFNFVSDGNARREVIINIFRRTQSHFLLRVL